MDTVLVDSGFFTSLRSIVDSIQSFRMTKVDWTLSLCCGTQEVIFCVLCGCYLIINFFLWNVFLVKPMKLIAVFVHEMGHAIMCWITGGSVKAIQVKMNEGGVTKYTGGCRCLIIPSGYLGGALFGGLLVACSGNRIASTSVACYFVAMMLISLCFAENATMVIVTLVFILITSGFIFLEWFVFTPLLPFVTLYYGVFIGSFSVYDIYDDLITRTVEGSDAHACHQLIPCCLPRCVGVQFAIIALALQAAGLYCALVWMTSTD